MACMASAAPSTASVLCLTAPRRSRDHAIVAPAALATCFLCLWRTPERVVIPTKLIRGIALP
eukprot:CAMPEP_0198242332 /NCGR_PEP_ID=MMETSP1446-20131203/15072_1 /TAXON_ID=1461542 ORGANISM="Unidentified sp, Strain CCMP2111" /NCGR_SAMPLE_ID=MMETSP1446 /ASSEMBLY_ACC=CAM_ASM_001112 /LENGTH=61 /DNA_ID=CAMNT_0043925737 /DNA_START=171 /DNA_END=356 /DNA_ORIENTATION=+